MGIAEPAFRLQSNWDVHMLGIQDLEDSNSMWKNQPE
jgi:hypothetical protein